MEGLAAGNGMVESLWKRIKGQANKVDVVVGVFCRPPSQDDANKLIIKELRDEIPLDLAPLFLWMILTGQM